MDQPHTNTIWSLTLLYGSDTYLAQFRIIPISSTHTSIWYRNVTRYVKYHTIPISVVVLEHVIWECDEILEVPSIPISSGNDRVHFWLQSHSNTIWSKHLPTNYGNSMAQIVPKCLQNGFGNIMLSPEVNIYQESISLLKRAEDLERGYSYFCV